MDIIGTPPYAPPSVIHDETTCVGVCCMHRPSDHVAVTWPLVWLGPKEGVARVCPHDHCHPDPDDKARQIGAGTWTEWHRCDGCCPAEIGGYDAA